MPQLQCHLVHCRFVKSCISLKARKVNSKWLCTSCYMPDGDIVKEFLDNDSFFFKQINERQLICIPDKSFSPFLSSVSFDMMKIMPMSFLSFFSCHV